MEEEEEEEEEEMYSDVPNIAQPLTLRTSPSDHATFNQKIDI